MIASRNRCESVLRCNFTHKCCVDLVLDVLNVSKRQSRTLNRFLARHISYSPSFDFNQIVRNYLLPVVVFHKASENIASEF